MVESGKPDFPDSVAGAVEKCDCIPVRRNASL